MSINLFLSKFPGRMFWTRTPICFTNNPMGNNTLMCPQKMVMFVGKDNPVDFMFTVYADLQLPRQQILELQ